MKKFLLIVSAFLLLVSNQAIAAKQTITSTDTGAQSRTKLNSNFTELYNGKADASCFATESAFNACFDLTWAAGGSMSWPASDGAYYAAKDGVWASLATVYQPLDSDLTTFSGLACTEGQIPKKNSSSVWVCGSDVEGEGGGISHATSDGNYYASRNGAWANIATAFATVANTLVGDCTVGPCLDGTSDGGTLIKLYGPGGYWQALQAGNSVANRSWRLPIGAPPSAGTTTLLNVNEYGQMGQVATSTYLTPSGVGGALTVTATGFDGNLATTDNTLQEIAQKVDDLVLGSGGGYSNLTEFVAQTAWRLFYSDASGDVKELALGSDGEYLKSNGAALAPSWATPSGAAHDAVTLGTDADVLLGLSTQQLTLDSQTANYVFAAPNGSAGDPTFRALTATDIPTLTLAKVSDAGTAAALDYGTDIGDLMRFTDAGTCSDTQYTTEATCESNTETWTAAVGVPFTLDTSQLTDTGNLLGGGGYTNLTSFVGQTAWRVFYSNGSGDVTELALGASGTVLKSNGETSAPSFQEDATAAGAGYVSTPPTYSDEACTAGQYALAEAYRYDCVASGNWNRTSLTDWSNPTPTTPTLTARVIGTNGTSLTLTGSASLSVGAGGNGGFDVDCATAGSGITATYASGAPGTGLVYTLGTTVNSGDTCDLDYTQPGNGIEATTGGADLASITSGAITNNSTQSTACTTPATGDVFNEGFLGTGYEQSRWTETVGTNGTVDEDYTLTGTGWPAGSCTEGLRTRISASGGSATNSRYDFSTEESLTTALDIYVEFNVASQSIAGYAVDQIMILKDQYNNVLGGFYLSDTNNDSTFGYYVSGTQYSLTGGAAHTLKIHLDPTLASSYIQVDGGTQRAFTRGNYSDLKRIVLGPEEAPIMDIEWGRMWVDRP